MNTNSQSIISELKQAVAEERKITTRVLRLLRMVDEGRWFLELGYSSLFDFSVRELGYAQDAANRRISAMRLIRDVPQIERKIESGALSLSVVTEASKFLRAERRAGVTRTLEQKKELVLSLDGLSKREAERTLLKSACPQTLLELQKVERIKVISPDLTKVTLVISKEQEVKIEKLKNLLSHQNPAGTFSGLLSLILDEALEKHDPELIEARRSKNQTKMHALPRPAVVKRIEPAEGQASLSRYIPAGIKRQVWLRDGGKCAYKGCNARRYLHYDHRIPHALGGLNTTENLRILCSAHNALEARELFGKYTPDRTPLSPSKGPLASSAPGLDS